MNKNQWIPVADYDGHYEISLCGDVRSLKGGKVRLMTPQQNKRGYFAIILYKDNKLKRHKIHRLMLESWVGPCPEGMECRHLNGNQGDNRLKNLKWGTKEENEADKILHGVILKGPQIDSAKLTDNDVLKIRNEYSTGMVTQDNLAKKYKVDQTIISGIVRGKWWKHVGGSITKRGKCKLTEGQVYEIRKEYAGGIGLRRLAKRYGVNKTTIRAIVRGETWKNTEGPISI